MFKFQYGGMSAKFWEIKKINIIYCQDSKKKNNSKKHDKGKDQGKKEIIKEDKPKWQCWFIIVVYCTKRHVVFHYCVYVKY